VKDELCNDVPSLAEIFGTQKSLLYPVGVTPLIEKDGVWFIIHLLPNSVSVICCFLTDMSELHEYTIS